MTVKCPCCNAMLDINIVTETVQAVPSTPIDFDSIIYLVCKRSNLSRRQIGAKNRQREVVYARQKIYWLGKKFCTCTLKHMGKTLVQQDHTTVIHSINQLQNLMDTDDNVRTDVASLCKELEAMRFAEPELVG